MYEEEEPPQTSINNFPCIVFAYNEKNVLSIPTKVFVQVALPRNITEVKFSIINNGRAIIISYKWLEDTFYSVQHFQQQANLPNRHALLVAMEHALEQMASITTEVTVSLAPYRVETHPHLTSLAAERAADYCICRIILQIVKEPGDDETIFVAPE